MSRALAIVVWVTSALTLTAATAEAQGAPQRDAFFGQTHSHTSWSLDAYIIGNHVTGPEDAYKFSLGQPIKHPAGFDVKLRRPLDFHGVTDHSEYTGMVRLANDPSSPVSKLPIAEKLKVRTPADIVQRVNALTNAYLKSDKGKAHMRQFTMEPVGGTPDDMRAFIKRELEKWGPIVRAANISM